MEWKAKHVLLIAKEHPEKENEPLNSNEQREVISKYWEFTRFDNWLNKKNFRNLADYLWVRYNKIGDSLGSFAYEICERSENEILREWYGTVLIKEMKTNWLHPISWGSY